MKSMVAEHPKLPSFSQGLSYLLFFAYTVMELRVELIEAPVRIGELHVALESHGSGLAPPVLEWFF